MTLWYISFCYWILKGLSDLSCICGYFMWKPDSTASNQDLFRRHLSGPGSEPCAWLLSYSAAQGWRGSGVGREGGGHELGHESCSWLLGALSLCPGEILTAETTSLPHSVLPVSWWGTSCHDRGKECEGHVGRKLAHIPGWDSGNINWGAPTAAGGCQRLTHPGSRPAPAKSVI